MNHKADNQHAGNLTPNGPAPKGSNLSKPFGIFAATSALLIGIVATSMANAQQISANPTTAPKVEVKAAAPLSAEDQAALSAAQANLAAAVTAYQAGNGAAAIPLLNQVFAGAPLGAAGDAVVMEAARRRGFIALESQDPHGAETYFASEAILARRLFLRQATSARRYSEAVNRWASAAGAMGRNEESAAFVFLARDIRNRDQAAQSAEVMNRSGTFDADEFTMVSVANHALCVTEQDSAIARRISCTDEHGARTEALQSQARQLRADAPPPPTKEEKEAKAKQREKEAKKGRH